MLLAEYQDLLSKEEFFWRQKSRETWLEVGDSNSKFFHASTKVRRGVNRILRITREGGVIHKSEDISNESVKYFTALLNNWKGSSWEDQVEI